MADEFNLIYNCKIVFVESMIVSVNETSMLSISFDSTG